jgi:hypothetical protein
MWPYTAVNRLRWAKARITETQPCGAAHRKSCCQPQNGLHRKSVTVRQCAGLVVGFGGTLLIFSPWHSASSVASAGGLECLAASISYAVSYVYMDKFLARRGMSRSGSRHASCWWPRR